MESYKLKQYVPKIYEDVLEMDELINAEQSLYDDVYMNSQQVEDNAFILTSDTTRVRDYEKLLKIKSNPSSESLKFRRERIINRLASKPPFTKSWLIEKLDNIIGKNNYKLLLDSDNYSIYIKVRNISDEWEEELKNTLSSTIPVNMKWSLEENPYTTWLEISEYKWNDLTSYTWEELLNL